MSNMFKSLKAVFSYQRYKLVFIVLAIVFLIIVGYFFYNLYLPVGQDRGIAKIEINKGDTAAIVAGKLKEQGLIRSEPIFVGWLRLSGYDNEIKAGEYYLSTNSNALTISKIISGELAGVNEQSLRFIEGWDLFDISKYLEEQGIVSQKEFSNLLKNSQVVNKLLSQHDPVIFSGALKTKNLEGYLFPDTYRFYQKATWSQVLNKMLDNFFKKYQANFSQVNTFSGYNFYQVLTLASIVEKEVPLEKDRQVVADILWRRLKKGMPLQADSTVNYITGKKTPSASLEDLKVDSLYNTYQHPGLPPGPISNPGLLSLKAVLNPLANDYWYFLTTPEGKVIYSKTFSEHVAAKQKYLK